MSENEKKQQSEAQQEQQQQAIPPETEGKSPPAPVDKVVVARKHPGVFMETSELVEETGVQLPVGISEGLGLSSKGGGGGGKGKGESIAAAAVKEEEKMETEEKVTGEDTKVDHSEKETEKETAECIGEVEVAAVPPDVKDLDVPADSSKKSLPEKEEKGKDKAVEGTEKITEEEKQKETDTDQVCQRIRLFINEDI